MDRCSQWYTDKQSRLIPFWVAANLFLIAVAYPLNWKMLVKSCCSVALTMLLHNRFPSTVTRRLDIQSR
jgi:hypothetical protein